MSIYKSIKQRYIRLSKGQRKVAQFVIDNPSIVATQTAAEVGRLANVSESTVIRFCYAMELTGYLALQELVRDYLLDKTGTVPIPKARLGRQQRKQSCSYIMQKDMKGIQDTMQLVNEENFDKCIHLLNEVESVHILGMNNSFLAASWLAQSLKQIREGVHMIESEEEMDLVKLPQLNADTLFVLFIFEKDLQDPEKIAEIVKVRKAELVVITDKAFSPIRSHTDAIFTIGSQQQSSIDKTPALFTFLHALVEGMIRQRQEQLSI